MTTIASFAKIRERAEHRKGSAAALESLLQPVPENEALRSVLNDRVLSAMAQRIFSAGFVWKVILDKWPGFEEAFLGFEPSALNFQPDEFWHDLAKDTRIVRNPQKIKAVQHNAQFILRVSEDHGSFGAFLADWPRDDQIGLIAYLDKHGSRLGGNTGQYFLRWIGWDNFILGGDVIMALRDAGLAISEKATSKKDRAAVQEQFNIWAAETGLGYGQMSRILACSIGENHTVEALKTYMGHD